MLWEILKAGRTNNSEDLFTRLAAEGISGAMNTSTVSGISPLVMPNCSGKPLISCIITGNTVQNGTPTTGTPVDVLGCGDYDSETGMYKIPVVTRGNEQTITTPIYLPTPLYSGEVLRSDGSRDVKWDKLVLTGDEQWKFYSDALGTWQFYINNTSLGGVSTSSCMSNIAPYGVTAITRHHYDYGCYLVRDGNGVAFQMNGDKDTLINTTSWKSYLAAKYAAGTPVTVWYQLADPTTETVTVPRIQTIRSSAATLSIGTHVQPENVTVKYRR